MDPNSIGGGAKVPSKARKKKDDKKEEDLSEEDLQLKQNLELNVERVQDPNPEVQKAALESMSQEISASTSVSKPLKFLRPYYGTLKEFHVKMAKSDLKEMLADILSDLAPIQDLPEDMLCHIISFLPTVIAVRTSSLAKRWRNIWLHSTTWDLNTFSCGNGFHLVDQQAGGEAVFVDLITRFLNENEKRDIKKFKLIYDVYVQPDYRLQSWIDNVIKRGVGHLDICVSQLYDEALAPRMPSSLYSSNTLVELRLECVILEDLGGVIKLPCVKKMLLKSVKFATDLLLEKIVIGCPSIEELSLIWDGLGYVDIVDESALLPRMVRVHSSSLRRFTVESILNGEFVLDIDCRMLDYLSLSGYSFNRIVIRNTGRSLMVDLDVNGLHHGREDPAWFSAMGSFLKQISTATHLKVSEETLEFIEDYFPELVRLFPART